MFCLLDRAAEVALEGVVVGNMAAHDGVERVFQCLDERGWNESFAGLIQMYQSSRYAQRLVPLSSVRWVSENPHGDSGHP